MLSDLRYRLRALFRREAVETELDDELRFHMEREVEKLEQRGLAPEEARRQARLAFGGRSQIAEDCREARGTSLVENTAQDVRYALRQLRANPGFAAVMILTLGLAIGANSAIFSVVAGVLLRPLPYPQSNRLVRLFETSAAYPKFPLNPGDFHDYRERSRSFEAMAGFSRQDLQISAGSGGAEILHGFMITADFFKVLEERPELGREFNRLDEVPHNSSRIMDASIRPVIISDRLWRTRYGADPRIIGKTIWMNALPGTVVGVMPRGLEHPGNEYHAIPYGRAVDIWTPFQFEKDDWSERGSHYLEGIGRLKDGVTAGEAQAELNAIMAQLAKEHPIDARWGVRVVGLDQEIVGATRPVLLMLLGAVGMVLLIACANASNLLLARAASRRKEMAVRLALGAPRGRLVRQLLTESLVTALAGGALGLGLAVGGVRAIVSLLPSDFPRATDIHVSAGVFWFTLAVALGTGTVFGLAPALRASRTDPRVGLHEGGSGSGRRQQRLRSMLVLSQVTLACMLLIGAGLMLRSLLNQIHLNPGFRDDHVLTATLSLPTIEYPNGEATNQFYRQMLGDLRALPGVQATGAGSDLPWTGWDENTSFDIEGKQPPAGTFYHARYHVATPDYFRALGVPLVAGRFFTEGDEHSAPVVIVNQAMAKKYWPGEDALGKRITFEDHPQEKDWLTVVGIVGDVKDAPTSAAAEPGFWWSHAGAPFRDMVVVVRYDGDPEAMAADLRAEVHRLNPGLAVANVRQMDQIVEATVAAPRMEFILVGLFGGLAIVLAGIGIYGLVAYSVSQRTPEFGVRMALGAQRWDVLRLVMAQVTGLVLVGTALGLLLAIVLGRTLQSLIYAVSPADPLTLAGAGGLVMVVAIVACMAPARRATGVDPMTALRTE